MDKMKGRAARGRTSLARLLLLLYILSMMVGQVCVTAFATENETQSVTEATVARTAETTEHTEATQAPAETGTPVTEAPANADDDTEDDDAPAFVIEEPLEKEPLCGREAHVHDDTCYDEDQNLICGKQQHIHDKVDCYPACGMEAHTHTAECYDEDGELVCDKEEHVHDDKYCYPDCGKEEHVHTADCLGDHGELICGKERHVHDTSCCPEPKPTYCGKAEHKHKYSCYDENNVLVCGREEHTHETICYIDPALLEAEETEPTEATEAADPTEPTRPEERTTYCGKEVHAHGPRCEGEDGTLICGKEVHVHEESCYVKPAEEPQETPEEKPTCCGLEAHTHGPDCFTGEDFVCTRDEHEHTEACYVNPAETQPAEPGEPTYFCGLEAHEHGETCYDENNDLVCGKEEHTHTEACAVKPEEKPLCCGKDEHTHGDGCYNEDHELICALEEHTHSDDCYGVLTTNCGKEAHVHTDACMDEAGNIICGVEAHTHTDDCYVPVYCGHVAHKHSALCLDAEGNRICGLEEHTHEESCFMEVPEGMALTCGKTSHTHGDGCWDENGTLVCELEEHTHTEECFSPILEGNVYYPVTDTANLDPETAYLVMGTEEEYNFLLSAELVPQPVNVVEGVDAEGNPCFQLDLGQPVTIMALNLTEGDFTEGETTDPIEDMEGTTEELPTDLVWIPAPQSAKTLKNAAAIDTELDLANGDNGLVATIQMDDEPRSMPVALFATGRADPNALVPRCDSECDYDHYLEWDDENDPYDDQNALNPFGDAHNYGLFLVGKAGEDGNLIDGTGDLDSYGVTHCNAAIAGNIKGTCTGITYDSGSSNDYSANITVQNEVGLLLGGTAEDGTREVVARNGSVIAQSLAGLDMRDYDEDHFHSASEGDLKNYFDTARSQLNHWNLTISNECARIKTRDEYDLDPANVWNQPENSHEGSVKGLSSEQCLDPQYQQSVAGNTYEDLGPQYCHLWLKGTNQSYNVFNIPASYLSENASGDKAKILYLDVPYGSYTLINVIDDTGIALGSGIENPNKEAGKLENFSMTLKYKDSTGKFIDQPANKNSNDDYKQTQRTVLNFDPTITDVHVAGSGAYIYASVMGPNVDMTATNSTTLQGNIVLSSLKGTAAGTGSNVNNAIIENPLEIAGTAKFNKFVRCESMQDKEHADNCTQIEEKNDIIESGGWDGLLVDITLTSLDEASGSQREVVLKGMHLDGTFSPVTDPIAPGDYGVKVEKIYKTDGTEVTDVTDQFGNYVDGSHVFSGAAFFVPPKEQYQIPALSEVYKSGTLYFHVNSGLTGDDPHNQGTIVNLYRKERESANVLAQKKWVGMGSVYNPSTSQYEEVEIQVSPPEGGFCEFALYKQRVALDVAGEPQKDASGAYITIPGSKTLVGKETVNAESNWFVNWRNVPEYEIDGDGVRYYLYYTVEESYTYPGYEMKGQPIYNSDTNQWIIKNQRKEGELTGLTVRKQWKDERGSIIADPTGLEAKVQLYKKVAQKPDPMGQAKDSTLKIIIGTPEDPIVTYEKQVTAGSDVTLQYQFYSDAYLPVLAQNQYGLNETADSASIRTTKQDDHGWDLYVYPHTIAGEVKNITGNKVVVLPVSSGYAGNENAVLSDYDMETYMQTPDKGYATETLGDMYWIYEDFQLVDWTALNVGNKWEHTFSNLEKEGPNGERYQYYILETEAGGNNKTFKKEVVYELNTSDLDYECDLKSSYTGNGDLPTAPAEQEGQPGIEIPGLTEGFVFITNQEEPKTYLLPEAGGVGTHLYTLGGMLLTMAAGLLLYKHGKRRKEDFASF